MVQRLRWVMLGVMSFSMVATLAVQPRAFWLDPSQAMRFDGLSIYSNPNPKFEFFIGHGWLPYVFACLIYFAMAFALVSVLPKKPALIAIFAFIFGHAYGGSTCVAVHWQTGVQGLIMYAACLGIALTIALLPVLKDSRFVVKRLAWIAAGIHVLDFSNTLIGQPHAYWLNPANVHEGNPLSRFFLLHGWFAFTMYDAIYCCVLLLLPVLLPRVTAMIVIFAFIMGGYAGASNWFFFVWRMGMQAPVLLGVVLSAMIVLVALASQENVPAVLRTAETV